MSARGMLLLACATLGCDWLGESTDICNELPPRAAEFRATCSKNGRPEDCAEAMDLCRDPDQSAAAFCRSICNDEPGGKSSLQKCRVDAERCALIIEFAKLECAFCAGL